MRGSDQQQSHVFSYISPEQRVRKDHPLRPIRTMVDKVLKELSPEFNKMYSKVGRPSIPPEQLLRALLLQMLYSVRSERLLVEEIDYNILFRWFVGLNLDDAVWDATVFTKNRDRLLEAEVAKDFLALVVEQARGQGWASDEHFTVDGSLLEAWASAKSFQPKNKKSSPPPDDPGNPTVDYRGEKRSNETHESKKRSGCTAGTEGRRQGGQVELQRESVGGESQQVDCVEPGVGSHGYGRALRGTGNAAGPSGKRAGDGGR
jgi:transposase